jgi:hypothetical protein
MRWPPEILAAMARGLEIEPAEGLEPNELLRALLDETARRAVWRCHGDPEKLGFALREPYTPLGSVIPEGLNGRVKRLTLHGERWAVAVDTLYDFMDQHAQEICTAFEDEQEPYGDLS